MQPLEQQSAEDFRDTPHGRQLLAGFRGLLFAPDLESEFRRYLGRQARLDRKSTRLNSSHMSESRMPSSA